MEGNRVGRCGYLERDQDKVTRQIHRSLPCEAANSGAEGWKNKSC